MDKERFSLLLLEPHEIYFEDFSVELLPGSERESSAGENPVKGRLKICSKSVVFDPKNVQLPLLKFHYSECQEISEGTTNNNSLTLTCTQHSRLLADNTITPYQFVRSKQTFVFHFHYIKVTDRVLQFCQQLHRASSLPAAEQNDMIATMVYSVHCRSKFDPLWMDSIFEKPLADIKVNEINPLVLNPGRLLLTDACLYFQPYNNIQTYPVKKIRHQDIKDFVRRRFLLRHIGLDIKWNENEHLYITFQNEKELMNFLAIAKEQTKITLEHEKTESMTLKWQNGLISNYEYLLYLNSLADRSFYDLTQYPIFPWIITDYNSEELDLSDPNIYRDLSKPIGALNPDRLKKLKERCEEMGHPKYLYGSHYSTPGFVLFYLVRKHPNLMLCLQNGRFDHPDRMFNSVSDAFRNCMTNMSDFKELIPEFYDTSSNMDFLVNSHRINFGLKHNGSCVNNVELPPWAKNSPKLFGKILRDALESDYVSTNLHNWIDLIFGYKQKGPEAEKANNLFYHLCYEGAIDLDLVKDPAERLALEVQISEFGQIPKQLFQKPHVSRNNVSSPEAKRSLNPEKTFKLEFNQAYNAHKDTITSIIFDENTIISTAKDGILKFYSLEQRRQTRSICMGSLPLSCCVKIPNSNVFALGSWDNNILLYNCNYGKTTEVIPAHEDSVTSLCIVKEFGLIISGSWDCSVKIWKGFDNIDEKIFRLSNSMVGSCVLDDRVNCLTFRIFDQTLQVVIGTESGEIVFWDVCLDSFKNTFNTDLGEPRVFLKHPQNVTSLAFNKDFTKLASASQDGSLNVTDVTTAMNLFSKKFTSPPTSICWYYEDLEYLLLVNFIGEFMIWDLMEGNLKLQEKLMEGPLTNVMILPENIVSVAGKNERNFKICCWKLK